MKKQVPITALAVNLHPVAEPAEQITDILDTIERVQPESVQAKRSDQERFLMSPNFNRILHDMHERCEEQASL